MVAEVTKLWAADLIVSPYRGNLDLAELHAATREFGGRHRHLYSAHPESADPDECAVAQRAERHQWQERNGEEYVDTGVEYYQQKYREQYLRYLKKQAAKQGFQLVSAGGVAA